jgi:hypothetical protein
VLHFSHQRVEVPAEASQERVVGGPERIPGYAG